MNIAAAVASLLFVVPAAAEAANDQVVPVPQYGEALVVPAASPVRFTGFAQPLDAAFEGRFVLTGVFTYGCEFDCDDGTVRPAEFKFYIVPDAALAARFPHWTRTHNDIRVDISGAEPFLRSHLPPKQRAALINGKVPVVTGRIAIVVDHFHTSVECNTVFWSARFVAVERPLKVEPVRVAGDFGCG